MEEQIQCHRQVKLKSTLRDKQRNIIIIQRKALPIRANTNGKKSYRKSDKASAL